MTDLPTSEFFLKQSLHVMAKPIGAICNLDCEYCYYLHKEELYPSGQSRRMTDETLETYIRQYIESQPDHLKEITFAWQGGEPTLLGLDFFHRVIDLQKKYTPEGIIIANSLQTNGVLLNDEWCQFFKEHRFLIGLSLDGPAELHDKYRYDKQGQGTFHKVMQALKLLKQHEVEFNALVVVNRFNGDHGRKVYTYLRDNGVQFLQFIPIVEPRGVGAHAEAANDANSAFLWDSLVSSRSVRPAQWGQFLIEVFDEWVTRDVGKVFVQIFDQALAAWMDQEPSLCVFRRQCGRALAIEHNGDLFCCDHFVELDYKLGNIYEQSLEELANSDRQRTFGAEKESTLPSYCQQCDVLFVCHGECPKNRIITTPDGEAGLNYLCEGYRMFFRHIDAPMRFMAEQLHLRRPPAHVMQWMSDRKKHSLAKHDSQRKENGAQPPAQGPISPAEVLPRVNPGSLQSRSSQHRPSLPQKINRNHPCSCGSGKKYKHCCLKKY